MIGHPIRRASRLLYALTAVVCISPRVDALDPARTLTQYVHRIWQVQQGLPQASITAITQTADGRLWLGTQKGLVTFDGVRFTTVSTAKASIDDIWVTALLEDRRHSLWIATDESGVVRFDHGVMTHYGQSEGLPSNSVQCVFEDAGGRVWVCTPAGPAVWNGRMFQPSGVDVASVARNVSGMCETPDGRAWLAHDDHQLEIWPARATDDRVIAAAARAGTIRAIHCARSGDVWIGTSSGLLQVIGSRVRVLTTSDGLADNVVITLAEMRDGAILVGTDNGFSRIRENDVESFKPRDGLSQSAVSALFEDREGTLWVGTGHGLNQLLDGRATPYTTSEGLPSNDTGPVLRDHTGAIWIGTLGGGLARFDGRRFTTLTTRDGLVSNTILALSETAGGQLWVGTDRGLNRIRAGRVDAALTTTEGLPSSRIQALSADAAGSLWIGTAHGLAVYRDGTVSRVARATSSIVAIGADHAGATYVAASDGSLASIGGDLRKVVRTAVEGGPALGHVDAIYADGDGVIWLGTAGYGLVAIDRGQISYYTVRDGLFDDSIYAVLADDRGRLWMACSKGIFSIERDELRHFRRGVSPKLVSTPYSPTDVLRTIECKPGIQPGVLQTPDGRLWFSTTRGVLVLDTQTVDRRFEAPPVAIDEITVNGEQGSATGVGILPPDRNNITFRYTGLSYVVPTRITFRYMLEGFDGKWIDAGTRREAFYTNLPPGHFRFRVSGCNSEGSCREADQAIDFSVQPRLYQRAWFVPACLAFVAILGFSAYGLRIRRLRERFTLILAERSRIARELHDTLIQGFSGITMTMQALAVRLPSSGERETLEQIIADAGASLRDARRSLTDLRHPQRGLGDALTRMSKQVTDVHGVRVKLKLDDCDEALPPEVEYNLLRIAQEAIVNAVKHSGAHAVMVKLERTASRIRLLVEDEGRGFAWDEAGDAGHFGIVGMRERARDIGADLDVETAPGMGTAVSVTIDG